MSRAVRVLLVLAMLAVASLLLASVRDFALPPLADWLDVGENPVCADYALVLPGDETNRTLYAAGLVRVGLVRNVLIPQNPDSADVLDGITLPTALISSRILQHRGIPLDRIVLLESESRTTFDDARALLTYLNHRDETVAVVTSAFHTRRTRFVFGKVLGDASANIRVMAAPNPGFESQRWWQVRAGLQLILTEYFKLGFYYIRYGGLWFWSATVAILVCLTFVVRSQLRHRSTHHNPSRA